MYHRRQIRAVRSGITKGLPLATPNTTPKGARSNVIERRHGHFFPVNHHILVGWIHLSRGRETLFCDVNFRPAIQREDEKHRSSWVSQRTVTCNPNTTSKGPSSSGACSSSTNDSGASRGQKAISAALGGHACIHDFAGVLVFECSESGVHPKMCVHAVVLKLVSLECELASA